MKKCSRCQQNKNEEEFYNYGNGKGHYCKVCTAHITKIQTLRFKLECITYKGGKCIKCGYDKLC